VVAAGTQPLEGPLAAGDGYGAVVQRLLLPALVAAAAAAAACHVQTAAAVAAAAEEEVEVAWTAAAAAAAARRRAWGVQQALHGGAQHGEQEALQEQQGLWLG